MNDYRNDPNNRYSTEYDAREQAPQQLYGQAQFDAYSRGASGEYTFKAKKKTPASKKILTGIIAVLCVAAIGTTSIVGYTLITGNNVIQSSDSESSSKKSQLTSAKTKSTVDRDNLPTIQQLSTPKDALTIPEIVEKVSPSVVGISCVLQNGMATGSGIIMSEDGYILTNAHVVEGAQEINVVLPSNYSNTSETSDSGDTKSSDESEDNLTYTAELVGADNQTDIAVLKIKAEGLTAAEFGTSADLQIGEAAIVIGNPVSMSLANSVTAGIISATDRTLTIEDRTINYIQTDAAINGGNSGGPLINAYGQVIGIASARVDASVADSLCFAIPIDDALPIVKDLMENGYVTGRPSLGISGTDVSSAYASYYGIPQGFLVKKVTEGSGAEAAGIQENDIVIGIEDEFITSISELNEVKNKYNVGDTVNLTIYRNGKKISVDVVLGEATGEITTQETETDDQQQQQQQPGYEQYYGGDGLDGFNDFYGFPGF
ncbi:MAG: trypsin-like peptidase domain-containing protein [Ruminococcus sp.]|nr:trypsin-like peptidase domain-containing protein [Ruminococcus sp.]